MALDKFWDCSAESDFKWGHMDCLTWSSLYVEAVAGFDPAKNYRGAYSDYRGARELLIKGGGLLNIAKRNMSRFPSGEVSDGVAIIKTDRGNTGAVLVDGSAWVKAPRGISQITNPKIIAGWTICQK